MTRSTAAVPVWAWPRVLSLDAPLIALAWQHAVARSFGVELRWPVYLVLFLTVWLVYLADRLLDSRKLQIDRPSAWRHRFHGRRQKPLWTVVAFAVLINALVVTWQFSIGQVASGLALLGLTLLHLACANLRRYEHAFTKELRVGFIFAIGVALPTLWFTPAWRVVPSTVILAFMFAINVVLIAWWDRNLDRAQSVGSIATSWPTLRRWLPPAITAVLIACVVLTLVGQVPLGIGVPASLSLAGMGLLIQLHDVQPTQPRSALADAVLLTPILWAIFSWATAVS